MSKQMKSVKSQKPRASRKGTEGHHEPVVEPYIVIIHDEELKKIIEELKVQEPIIEIILEEPILEEPILEEPIIEILLEEPIVCPEVEQQDIATPEYVAKYSPCGTKVLNPQTNRYVACDGAIAKKLSLCR